MEISTDELRLNFDRVLHNLRKGIPMTLTYQNKQIAPIVPVESEQPILREDPFYELAERAEDMGGLSNAEIDREVYGSESVH